jgi:hypothetical protein
LFLKTKKIVLAALVALTFFIICDSNDETTDAATLTTDEIAADSNIDITIDDVSIIVDDQYAMQQSPTGKTAADIKSVLPPCATITTVLTNETWIRTIDF